MSSNEELYENAKKAIEELFSDRSVSIQEAIGNLHALQDEIYIYIDALKADLARGEE